MNRYPTAGTNAERFLRDWFHEKRSTLLALTIVALLWEIVGQLELIANGTFPSLSGIATQLWSDRSLYPSHIFVTLRNATVGFVAGNLAAIVLAFLFTLLPFAERLLRGILISIFSIPLIVVAPIVGLSFGGDVPKMVLAGLAVYFPTLISLLVSLRDIDPTIVDVVRAAGGGRWMIFRKVRIRSSLSGLMSGLRVAAPWAILGSMLAEFLGGRWGLGVFMLGSLGRAIPERLWGIGLIATAIAAIAYGVFGAMGFWFTRSSIGVSLVTGASPSDLQPHSGGHDPIRKIGQSLVSIAMTLLIWEVLIRVLGLPRVIANGPMDVYRFLFLNPQAAENQLVIAKALAETLPAAGLGLACGLAAAFILATLLSLWPSIGRSILPFALVTQSMPLVALTPLVVLVLGRGPLSIVVVTVLVTFFPSFVTISHGLAAIPRSAMDLMRVYRASPFTTLWKMNIPSALPYLLASARLAAPRALLGVMLAEYLATGTGLGFLLAESRGKLNFRMMWVIAAMTAGISIILYQLVSLAEAMLLRRFGSAASTS